MLNRDEITLIHSQMVGQIASLLLNAVPEQKPELLLKRFQHSRDGYYDLILIDIRMPVMNGYEATRAIRRLPGDYAADIPIIALTANIFQDDILEAMESGMNEHLSKPIDMREVGKILKKWLQDHLVVFEYKKSPRKTEIFVLFSGVSLFSAVFILRCFRLHLPLRC